MKQHIDKYFNDIMPLYANGRIDGIRRRLFEAWLRRSPTARHRLGQMEAIRRTAAASLDAPSGAVWSRIRADIRSQAPQKVALRPVTWRMGMALAVLLIALSWFVFPPSIALEWHVEGAAPEAFHIYRAASGSQDFVLVGELSAENAVQDYRYVDLQLIPGRQVTYKIEAIGGNGIPLTSQIVVPEAGIALPNQLALFLALGVVLYGLMVLAWSRSRLPEPRLTLRAG